MAYPTDPVARWCPSLDTAGRFTSTLNDLTGNGNNGTLTLMDPATDWVLDGGKYALDFDGTDDYVNCAISQSSFGSQFTISSWVKIVSGSGQNYRGIAGAHTSSFNGISFGQYQTNYLSPGSTPGWQFASGIIAGVSAGELASSWTHITSIFDVTSGISIYLYVNDVYIGSTTRGDTFSPVAAFWIGRAFDSWDRYFLGQIDDMQIFNRALTSTEISDLYTADRGYQATTNRSTFQMGNPI